jgi:hypothetical protein
MKSEHLSLTLQKRLTALYLGYMFIVFVLGYHEQYFDLAQAKRAIYLYGTGTYLIFMLFCALPQFASHLKNHDFPVAHTALPEKKTRPAVLSLTGLSLVVLMLSSLFGLIDNIDVSNAFWGIGEKSTGLLLYLLGWTALFSISRTLEWDGLLSWIYLFVCITEYVLQILNRFSIDPLLMYENLITDQIPAFLGTLGHMNYNASFDCMMLALNLVFFLNSREKLSQGLYALCMFLGFAGSVCCNSDSVFLGIAAAFAVAAWYCCTHPEKWMRLWLSACLFSLASTLIALLYALSPEPVVLVNGSTAFTGIPVLAAEYLLLLISRIILAKCERGLQRNQHILQTICSIGLPGASAAGVLFIIWKARDISFASGRGLIWQKCLVLFADAPVFHKLFGYGFNNIRPVLESVQGNAWDLSGTDTIMDAHNIFLNTLITSGILGTAAWGVLLFTLIKKGLQLSADHENALFILIGIATYLIQGLVNGPQVITTPVFLTELGVLWGIAHQLSGLSQQPKAD